MPRLYENLKPVYPEFKSPVPGHGATCGLSYHEWLEVRAPYADVDQYVNALPVIYGDMMLGSQMDSDFEDILNLALQPSVKESISEGIEGAKEMARNYRKDGFLDTKNSAETNKMLNRAEDYLKKAKRIQDYWDDAWVGNDLAQGWPLKDRGHPLCGSKVAPETVKTLTMGPKGATTIEVTCPERGIFDDHEADRQLMVQLVQAALFNTRCAQEAIAAVGTYNRNKKFYDDRKKDQAKFGLGTKSDDVPDLVIAKIAPPPGSEPSPMPIIPDDGPPIIPPTDDDSSLPEPDFDDAKPKRKSRKRSGAGLAIGVAAIGFIAMKGKK